MSRDASDHAGSELAKRVSFLSAGLPLTTTAAADADGPAPHGVQVLGLFLGLWNTVTHIHNVGPPPRDIEARGRAVCARMLEDRYVEFRSVSISPPGEAELQIMTYEADTDRFRQWVFDSDGYRHEAVGRWNPTARTITWEGRTADGSSFVIQDHWVSPNRLEWTLKRRAADGRLLQTIEGVVSRAESRER
jgi:hypothetical protein